MNRMKFLVFLTVLVLAAKKPKYKFYEEDSNKLEQITQPRSKKCYGLALSDAIDSGPY